EARLRDDGLPLVTAGARRRGAVLVTAVSRDPIEHAAGRTGERLRSRRGPLDHEVRAWRRIEDAGCATVIGKDLVGDRGLAIIVLVFDVVALAFNFGERRLIGDGNTKADRDARSALSAATQHRCDDDVLLRGI